MPGSQAPSELGEVPSITPVAPPQRDDLKLVDTPDFPLKYPIFHNTHAFPQLQIGQISAITTRMSHTRIYSTSEVAHVVGVHKGTLVRWLLAGRLAEPRRSSFAGTALRLWSERDLQRVKAFKAANYRIATVKGRGRKSPQRAGATYQKSA